MVRWLGLNFRKHGVRTLLLTALAVGVAGVSAAAGDVRDASTRLKAKRQLRALERLSLAPRTKAHPTLTSAQRPQVSAAPRPAVVLASAPNSPRLFPTKDVANASTPQSGSTGPRSSPCVVTGRSLLGEPQLARFAQRIGEVDIERCFAAIPAWKAIRQEDLRPTRARYHFLMRQANQDLSRAIAAVAAARGVTLVVERGGVQNPGDKVSDLTQAVLDALSTP